MGKIGDDIFGRAILDMISRYDPDLKKGMIKTAGGVSSYSIILSSPEADRMFFHCPGCNDTFGADDVDYKSFEDAALFHFGYPPLMRRMIEQDGIELTRLFSKAKRKGLATSLDMSMPDPASFSGSVNWPSILSETLPHVDVFLPSVEEILYVLYPEIFSSMSEPLREITPELLTKIGNDLLSMGPKIVGLKLGHFGLYLQTADAHSLRTLEPALPVSPELWAQRQLWSPCFEVDVVGTTGAGDATIAGFLASLLRGLSPEEAANLACAVGACNVEASDALSGIRPWPETLDRLNSAWSRHDLPFDMLGWHHSPGTRIWLGPGDASLR
jgi:sugar/nucleoside kinase (ribokinase family)